MIFEHAGEQKKYRGRVQAYDEAADNHTVRGHATEVRASPKRA